MRDEKGVTTAKMCLKVPMESEELKKMTRKMFGETYEEARNFLWKLRKLKVTELPGFKEEYENIKRTGSIINEQHEDTMCIIDYVKDGERFNHILAEQTKTNKQGESFRDVYYINPKEFGVVYVEHRYLIDNDNPMHKIGIERSFPVCQKDWAYLWRNVGEE